MNLNANTQDDFRLLGVLETCLYVSDLTEAERFYCDVLGLQLESRQPGRHVFLYCGQQMLLLFEPNASNAEDSKMPRHGAVGRGHVAFRIPNNDISSWQERLVSLGVEIETIIEWPRSEYRSLYFRDPAGNSLELTTGAIWGLSDEEAASDEEADE